MARTIGASGNISLAIAESASDTFNPMTFMAFARRTTDGSHQAIISFQGSGGTTIGHFGVGDTNNMSANNQGVAFDGSSGPTVTASDGWCFLAWRKSTGSGNIRFTKIPLLSLSPTHTNGSVGSFTAWTAPTGGVFRIGNNSFSEPWQGDIAAVAHFTTDLTDAQVESCAMSLTTWLMHGPRHMWVLDQSATTMKVVDWCGTSNESSLSSTSISSSSPLFSYGTPILPAMAAPSGSSDGTATPSAVATPIVFQSTTVAVSRTATPSAIATPITFNAATVTGGAVAAPSAIATPVTFPAATVVASSTTAQATISLAVTFPTPTASGSTSPTVTPSAIATPVTFNAPTVAVSRTTTPSAIATPITFNAPSVAAGTIATPSAIATPITFTSPTISAGATVTPSVLATPITFNAPSVSGGIAGTATPSAIATPIVFNAATVFGGALATPSAVATPIVFRAQSVKLDATVIAAVIAFTIVFRAVTFPGYGPDITGRITTSRGDPLRTTTRADQARTTEAIR